MNERWAREAGSSLVNEIRLTAPDVKAVALAAGVMVIAGYDPTWSWLSFVPGVTVLVLNDTPMIPWGWKVWINCGTSWAPGDQLYAHSGRGAVDVIVR